MPKELATPAGALAGHTANVMFDVPVTLIQSILPQRTFWNKKRREVVDEIEILSPVAITRVDRMSKLSNPYVQHAFKIADDAGPYDSKDLLLWKVDDWLVQPYPDTSIPSGPVDNVI